MTSTKRRKRGRPIGADRHIAIRSTRRAVPDMGKYAKALVSLALAQAEADAQAHNNVIQLDESRRIQRDHRGQ
jgi:hypothetical protein